MRELYVASDDSGSYMLEPDEIPEFERDLDKIKAIEIACGTDSVYDKAREEFDKKWSQWEIVLA